MIFIVLVLTGILCVTGNLLGQAPDPSALPDGVYVQSFQFRPIFRDGEEEKEWMPTNALEPRPREGSIATRPTSTGIQSPESLRKEPPRERLGFEVYLQLKNSGSRAIKKLEWDFLFLDSQSRSELKRFNIRSKSRIRSGEVKFLTKQVLPGLFLGNRSRPDFARGKSAVIIRAIEFADGSKWQGALRKP